MSRYSLRQTPRKKEPSQDMMENNASPRQFSSRQSSVSPEMQFDAENDFSYASEISTRSRSSRRRSPKMTVDPDGKEDQDASSASPNGKSATQAEVASGGLPEDKRSTAKPEKKTATTADIGVVDGWIAGRDPKIDYSGEFEFGGPCGTLSMMLLFPTLMWYMWIGATYYDGKLPSRAPNQSWLSFASQLVNFVYVGAFPHAKAWLWYWSYLFFQGAFYCLLPGVWAWGKPLPHEGGKQLKYFCNAYVTLYTTLAILTVLHFSGIWPLYTAIDEFGPLLSVAILSGFLVSFAAYFSALYRGKQHRMTGYPIYDFFMGAELNPRMFGILDFKMLCEVRMPWYFLLILSLGAAARQWERYGYVSGEVWFLVMAHYLYANACAKGEELISTTWDIYYEKWGFMLIFWNLAGVPLSYCHCTIYLANHDPSEYRWSKSFLVAMFVAYLFWYWVWDTCNSQKNCFRAMERGKLVARNTFPQLPWRMIHNPKTIETPQGTLLVDGWYGLGRKIHYTADVWFSVSWGLITGFKSPFPWFYPIFFCFMIAHRAARDIHRCRNKYGEYWLEYERKVPYLFIPYVI